MGLSVRICTTWSCMREKEGAQQVRLGSPARKNSVASSRRVQNSAGIPGVSSPMGNNEDSASFITTCSSIPDLTTRVPVFPPPLLPSPIHHPRSSCARKGCIQRYGVCLALELLRQDTCRPPTPPPTPYFQPVPTDARRLPRKRSRLGYSEPRDGFRYSGVGYRVRTARV